MIEVRDLAASYGAFALRGVNLELRESGCLAILGPSGAGKTLLLETVMGARRPDEGRVLLDGRDITRLPPESRRIAYIPQDLALFPHLSVRDNIMFGLRPRAARQAAAPELQRLTELLRIGHLLGRRDVATLSGGEKQRVALARALIVKPRVLFLDEPFGALDAATSGELLRAFRGSFEELGATVFLVTHDLGEACFLAGDIAIMMEGRIVEYGPRDQVVRHPKTVRTARFLNVRNILPRGGMAPAVPDGAENGYTHVAVRPEDVGVHPLAEGGPGALRARLTGLIPVGSHVIAELALGGAASMEAAVSYDYAAALEPLVAGDVAVSLRRDGVLYLSDD